MNYLFLSLVSLNKIKKIKSAFNCFILFSRLSKNRWCVFLIHVVPHSKDFYTWGGGHIRYIGSILSEYLYSSIPLHLIIIYSKQSLHSLTGAYSYCNFPPKDTRESLACSVVLDAQQSQLTFDKKIQRGQSLINVVFPFFCTNNSTFKPSKICIAILKP